MVKARYSHGCSKKTASQGILYLRERHSPITAEIGSVSNFCNGINYICLVNPFQIPSEEL